jgi:hypothetical protein
MRRIWFFFLIFLLVAIILAPLYVLHDVEGKPPEGFFFGVSYGQQTVHGAKLLIDRVKGYTNFFVINNWDISTNETALNEVCDYAAEAGLKFIVFFDYVSLGKYVPPFYDAYPWHEEWVLTAKERWGENFLGIYIYEEPGGKQISTGLFDELFHDDGRAEMYENVTTYSEAAEVFVRELPRGLSFHFLQNSNITRFVSDYALYWYDYLAGYDTVFAELGWNHSTPQQIGLCRGAATAQNKDWGTIITWKSPIEEPASIKNASEMLQDMLVSYEAGAKYIVIFNFPQYPEGNPFGILTDDHFTAMEQFWNHVTEHPEEFGKTSGQVAYVLPKDYGWGMRNPDDNIWFPTWGPDEKSPLIWENMNKLIEKYGLQLDLVYEDPRFTLEKYSQVYFWNATID